MTENDRTKGTAKLQKLSNSVGASGAVPGVTAFDALKTLVDRTQEYVEIRETERTKRRVLETYEKVEVKRIQAAENLLRQYFDTVFEERSQNFEKILQRYDEAVGRGDGTAAAGALQALIDLARESPLSQLGDLAQLRAALDDPDHVWEL